MPKHNPFYLPDLLPAGDAGHLSQPGFFGKPIIQMPVPHLVFMEDMNSSSSGESEYPEFIDYNDTVHYMGDYQFTTHLNRHPVMWMWMKLYALPKIVEEAKKHRVNGQYVLKVLHIGPSTGEEMAESFHHIVTWLEQHGENVEKDWDIIIQGIEKVASTAKKAERRLMAKEPFEYLFDAEDARPIRDTLNRHFKMAKKSFRIDQGDGTDDRILRAHRDSHMTIANNVILYLPPLERIPFVHLLAECFTDSYLAFIVDWYVSELLFKHHNWSNILMPNEDGDQAIGYWMGTPHRGISPTTTLTYFEEQNLRQAA